MSPTFDLAFFGSQHNYLVQVADVGDGGFPLHDSLVSTYGLPTAFAKRMTDQVRKSRAYYDIRGHDFLSHSGHWKGRDGTVGYVATVFVPLSESSKLESIRLENEQHKSSLKNKSEYSGLSMYTFYGPGPGSLFVDAYKLECYDWKNLPDDLTSVVGRLCQKDYEKCRIWDVQMNALGGWVILLKRGKDFLFGGELPFELRILFQEVQKRKKTNPKQDAIYRFYMNHQHPDEYVLIFADGRCFVHLHSGFEADIRRLLSAWGENEKHPKFHITFNSSSNSSEACQQVLNAAYYSRRGIFFLSRLNEAQALLYLREATDLDNRSSQILENYCMAIIGRLAGMRRKNELDSKLEEMIRDRPARTARRSPPPRMGKDEGALFRAEYMWMLEEQDIDIPALEKKLDELQRPFLDEKWHLAPLEDKSKHEWSYEKAVAGNDKLLHELESREVVVEDSNQPVEVQAEDVLIVGRTETGASASELSSYAAATDRSRSEEIIAELGPGRRCIVLDPPVAEKPLRGQRLLAILRFWPGSS